MLCRKYRSSAGRVAAVGLLTLTMLLLGGCPSEREQPQAVIEAGQAARLDRPADRAVVAGPATPIASAGLASSDTPAGLTTSAGAPAATDIALPPVRAKNPFAWSAGAAPVVAEAQGLIGRVAPMLAVWDAANQRMNLAGCGREVVGFQFQVAAGAVGLPGAMVAVSDLELVPTGGPGHISSRTIELCRIMPTRVVRLPGWYQLYETAAANRSFGDFPDALVPIDHLRLGQPWNIGPNEKLGLWADVPIPADTTPGIYEGRVRITSNNQSAGGFAIRLEVLPLNLPAEPALKLICPLDFKQMLACELGRAELSDSFVLGAGRATAAKRLAQWVDLGRRHGVQFVVADLAPVFKRDLAGNVQIDWSGYDEVLSPQLDGEGTPLLSLAPFRLDYPDPGLYGGLKAEPYKAVAGQYLRALGRHWATKKWGKPLVWVHRDQPAQATLPYGCPDWRDWLTDQRRQESVQIGDLVLRAEMGIGYLESLPWAMRRSTGVPAGAVSSASPGASTPPTVPPTTPGASAATPSAAAGRFTVPDRLVPPHVTIYAPDAQFLDSVAMAGLQSEGQKAWLGPGGPPWRPSAAVFAHAEQLESLAYIAHRYGLDTIWLGPAQRWPGKSPLQTALPAAEANFLFYSGRWFDQDRPVASLRLKFLRQATQTAACLKLLGDLHRRPPADAISGAMVKHALADSANSVPGLGGPVGWQQEPVYYLDARLMLREELLLAAGRGGNPAAAESRMRFLWLHFHERTAWVRLGAFPGQLVDQLDSFGAPSGSMRAVLRLLPYCDSAVCNPTLPGEPTGQARWPMLGFGPLPATWKPTRFNVPVEGQSPGAPISLALAADGVELPIDNSARLPMPLTLKGETGQDLVAPADSTPVLPAHPFSQPPRIDGKLDEWPTGNWFKGEDFARLASPEPASMFALPPPPPSKTWFMAGYDDQGLYLAVACLGQKPAEVTARYANDIDMDNGLIVNEDAVEVVLDPTGGRLDRQGLLHLVIKPTGTVLGWRGLTGPGGTGKPEPWGRNVRAVVSFQPTYWLIEMAVPRSELGPTNAHGLWRVDVIRHLAALGEHSAWASSSPLLGEPESLGNLLLRRPPLPKHEVQLAPVSPLEN